VKVLNTHATLEEINEAISQGWSNSEKNENIANEAGKQATQKEDASSTSIKVSELKVFDPADFINDAEDVMLYLKLTLSENDPLSLADALEVILRSDGIKKLIGNSEAASKGRYVPTLREMIAKCDLSAEPHPDSEFDKAQAKGKEDI
jgi:DNA-binding phage protein